MQNELTWQRRILPNGLRLLLYPRKSVLTTQIGVAINYGANMDSDLTAGRAHFLEHMIAGGSDKRIDLSRKLEFLGGIIDFETRPEYTYCYIDVTPEKISDATKILSELLFDSIFDLSHFIKTEIINSSSSCICQ